MKKQNKKVESFSKNNHPGDEVSEPENTQSNGGRSDVVIEKNVLTSAAGLSNVQDELTKVPLKKVPIEYKGNRKPTSKLVEDASKKEVGEVIRKKYIPEDRLTFENILDLKEYIPEKYYIGEFNTILQSWNPRTSDIYQIIKKNDDFLLDKIIWKNNIYEVIVLFYDIIHNFLNDVRDMRIFGLLFYKLHFDITKSEGLDRKLEQFDNYFEKFIRFTDSQAIEKQANKDVFKYLEQTIDRYEHSKYKRNQSCNKRWTYIFLSAFWRKIYIFAEKRDEDAASAYFMFF